MLKTNSEVVKRKSGLLSQKKLHPAQVITGNNPGLFKKDLHEAAERVKGTKEKPLENIVNSCTCFFYGDFEIFEIVQSWTESNYKPTETNINKALTLYYNLLDREIRNIIK